jgi:hypothetical protein
MCRVIFCTAALLFAALASVSTAPAQSSTGETGTCTMIPGDETIAACGRILQRGGCLDAFRRLGGVAVCCISHVAWLSCLA